MGQPARGKRRRGDRVFRRIRGPRNRHRTPRPLRQTRKEVSPSHPGMSQATEQVPIGRGEGKSGIKPAQRPAIFDFIGYDGKPQDARSVRPNRGASRFRPRRGPRTAICWTMVRLPRGSRALSVPCAGWRLRRERIHRWDRASHEMILATSGSVCPKEPQPIVELNKKVYICLIDGICHAGRLPQSRRRVRTLLRQCACSGGA